MKVPSSTLWPTPMRNFHRRLKRKARGFKLGTGLKKQYLPGSDESVYTPYFANERSRRRRRGKAAKQARKVNR